MISLHPTGSPAETNAAYTLLEIISNPDRAKKHLDGLIAEKKAAVEAMDNAREAVTESVRKTQEARKILDAAGAKEAEMKSAHGIREKQLNDHEAVLSSTQKRLEKFESDLNAREAAVKAKEVDLVSRESEANDLLEKAKAAHADAERHKAFHEDAANRARELLAPRTFTLDAEAGRLTNRMGEAG